MTLLVASIPVFFLVHAVLLYSVWRFRATTASGDGPPIGSHRTIETGWVVVTLVMVLALAAYGWNSMDEMRSAGAAAAHAGTSSPRPRGYRLPAAPGQGDRQPVRLALRYRTWGKSVAPAAGWPVRFEITSMDVLHSFWISVPDQAGRGPRRTITLLVTPTAVGRYAAECTALCSAGHRHALTRRGDGARRVRRLGGEQRAAAGSEASGSPRDRRRARRRRGRQRARLARRRSLTDDADPFLWAGVYLFESALGRRSARAVVRLGRRPHRPDRARARRAGHPPLLRVHDRPQVIGVQYLVRASSSSSSRAFSR